MNPKTETAVDDPLTFEQGYVCAVANLLRDHGAVTEARDLLGGMPDIDWPTIDPYDRDQIKRHGLFPNTPTRGAKISPSRSS
jgi:hypothetical protein